MKEKVESVRWEMKCGVRERMRERVRAEVFCN